MANEKNISRRAALKVIAVGVGTASALPVLNHNALGQHAAHDTQKAAAATAPAKAGGRFFTPHELETVDSISNLIIPADEHSPGASAAGVYAFIDLMVSESSDEVKKLWRDGLAAVDKMSETRSSAAFLRSSQEQQTALLKAISRNERRPKAIEEQFFVAIKSLTVDGYYTSEIGIHQELRYQGNVVLKDFAGCTHPEHKAG
jgi:hypothetical protein